MDMGHWPFILLAVLLAAVVYFLGGVDTTPTNGRGPGVTDKCGECGQKKKPSTWGGPR